MSSSAPHSRNDHAIAGFNRGNSQQIIFLITARARFPQDFGRVFVVDLRQGRRLDQFPRGRTPGEHTDGKGD
ncbi:MAG: hypothetical protein B7X35_04890 [Halothiobacillus sp. 14-56-357]|nr:MAG: hypothetical protein B7X35_04890 [Halothiobacillus sp. 14-56-357]